ncbi:hypothetical protein [Blastopirellula marina]|uniref:hypothetical protein n=1 Tax=Blastopirellula marina TaxID=124 RepID=UPI001304D62B|nr:hypothetical protein [Blastopirellula marina]
MSLQKSAPRARAITIAAKQGDLEMEKAKFASLFVQSLVLIGVTAMSAALIFSTLL